MLEDSTPGLRAGALYYLIKSKTVYGEDDTSKLVMCILSAEEEL